MSVHPMYEIYLKERGDAQSSTFRATRETIARALAIDAQFAQWYIQRLSGRGYGFAPSYADVARSAERGLGGPSLAEATQETVRRNLAIEASCEMLAQVPGFQCVILGGSFPWKQYNLLSNRCRSDLDMTAVFDVMPHTVGTDTKLHARLSEFHQQHDALMLKQKIFFDTISVSFHLWTTEMLEMVRSIDYAQLSENITISCLREAIGETANGDSAAGRYGPQHNFAGDAYTMAKNIRVNAAGSTICDQHLACVGTHGEFVMGAALDMMVFGSTVFGPHASQFLDTKQDVVRKLHLRMQADAKKLPGKSLSFANLPHHRETMPRWLIDEIRVWDKEDV